MMCKRWLMICICFSFKVSASDSEKEGSLWAGLLPWVVIYVVDNSISLEGHIIMYFQIKSQLRGHASLWELVQSQCQACNSKVLQSRAPERRINRSEAQSTPCVLPNLTLPSGRNMAFFLHLRVSRVGVTGHAWAPVPVGISVGSADHTLLSALPFVG